MSALSIHICEHLRKLLEVQLYLEVQQNLLPGLRPPSAREQHPPVSGSILQHHLFEGQQEEFQSRLRER
jgi:hypothetical protein